MGIVLHYLPIAASATLLRQQGVFFLRISILREFVTLIKCEEKSIVILIAYFDIELFCVRYERFSDNRLNASKNQIFVINYCTII
jgi:hypothetical protein